MTTPDSNSPIRSLEAELDRLERAIARGQAAYARRNEIIVALVDAGRRQTDVLRLLNRRRTAEGVSPLTLDAVSATLQRTRSKDSTSRLESDRLRS